MQLLNPQTLYHKQPLLAVSPQSKKEGYVLDPNKNYSLLVVYESGSPELPVPLKDMLDKLIGACRFKVEETAYINRQFSSTGLDKIMSQFQPQAMLIFGDIAISRNMARLSKNRPYEINGIKILRSENLEKLDQMIAEKQALWAALKQMFKV
jgi:hypothetical protein